MKIRFVQQQKDNDCVLASVAMITGETLEDMYNKYKINLPLSLDDAIKILTLNGFVCERILRNQLYQGKVYFACVPSLNFPGINHNVIFDLQDGFELFDPNEGREDKLFYQTGDDTPLSWGGLVEITDAKTILKEDGEDDPEGNCF